MVGAVEEDAAAELATADPAGVALPAVPVVHPLTAASTTTPAIIGRRFTFFAPFRERQVHQLPALLTEAPLSDFCPTPHRPTVSPAHPAGTIKG